MTTSIQNSKLNTQNVALALALLLALGLRLALWSQPLHQPANDEIEYITVARDLLAGRGWQLYDHFEWLRAPLYPLFLAGSLWLSAGDLHRAALPNILLSVANVWLIARLAAALVGRRAVLPAALLAALLWTNATFASLAMAETLWTFLFTAALLFLVGRRTKDEGRRLSQSPFVLRPSSLVFAGVLLGLATLTRSITLLFLPFVLLWLLARQQAIGNRQQFWRSLLSYCLLPIACCLVIAPWTIRNYLAYGRFIPVETGLAYNVWAFNEPREDMGDISRALVSIRNPAERSDYAMARGLARLREDPAILLRKLWPNWIYLWRVKPIQDRFLQESYYADVPLPVFTAALVFDDSLYLLIALAALAGLACYRPPDAPRAWGRWLCLAWLGYAIATMLLTHGEARYRHFLFPVLIPYAAATLVQCQVRMTGQNSPFVGRTITASPLHRFTASPLHGRRFVTVALAGLLLCTVASTYPWDWAARNLARGWHTAAGDLAWAIGQPAAARIAYTRAAYDADSADGWLRLGDVARATGDAERAVVAYSHATRMLPLYIPASARLGDMLRSLGETQAAQQAFVGSYASAQEMADWSWRELRPAPRTQIDVGDGLDFGYVGGVYPAEDLQGATARWTNGRGQMRLGLAGDADTVFVELWLAAPHPGGAPVQAQVCAAAQCWPITLGPAWRIYRLPFRAGDGPLTLDIRSATFNAPDGRALGVLIERAAVTEGR